MPRKPRILLIDDDEVFYRLLDELFGGQERLSLRWEATGARGIRALEQSTFDLVIVDYQLPDMLGLEVFDAIDKLDAPPPHAMFTGYGSIDLAVDAMKRGAADFFTKPLDRPDDLVRFVNRTLALDPPLPLPEVSAAETQVLPKEADAESPEAIRKRSMALDPPVELSEREAEICAAVIEGLANKEAASALHISEQTVKNHLTAIYRKLGVASRAQLVRRLL